MTEPTLNEQIARRLGWVQESHEYPCDIHGHITRHWRNPTGDVACVDEFEWSYSHDAIHCDLLLVLTEEQWHIFIVDLLDRVKTKADHGIVRPILTATPEQLCKSWLAATEPKL